MGNLIGSVSLLGRKLASWTIFKGKVSQVKWHKKMENGDARAMIGGLGYHICTSENGWTDNELGVAYLEKHFEFSTLNHLSTKKESIVFSLSTAMIRI